MRKGPCPICSKKPLNELIDLQGRPTGACQECLDGFRNLKRVYHSLLEMGLSEKDADRKMAQLLNLKES